jgi:Tol biopolymer transport system component
LGELDLDPEAAFQPEQLIESYPATYGWWGGNYAWSPQGRLIAYSFANEVGVIDVETVNGDLQRRRLQEFTEYNTRSDWVWVPTLTWSPNGRFLAFTNHDSSDPEELAFSSWVVDVESGVNGRFVPDSGMWAHLHWSQADDGPLAFLKATDPLYSQLRSYALWLMDGDGSNGRRLYPPLGELTRFPNEQNFMAWGPEGQSMAFIFDDALYIFDVETAVARLISQEDAIASHPTWAPYGTGQLSDEIEDTDELPLPIQNETGQFLPDG